MVEAFEELNFLMASRNRLEVLLAIAERPRDRDALVEATDTSPVTIGRIVDDFLERNWIDRHDGVFSTTLLGEVVAEDATSLDRSVGVAADFSHVAQYCPRDEIDFDPRLLEHAWTSVGPEDTAFDHVDRWTELFRRTDEFWGITGHIPTTLIDLFTEEIRTNGMTVVGVYSSELVDEIADDPDKRAAARDTIDAGAELYVDEKVWEMAIGIYDGESMSFVGFDDTGSPRFKVESDHPALVQWSVDRFERVKARATPLQAADFEG